MMEDFSASLTPQLVFDQFRNIFGGNAAVLVFAGAMFPRRKKYGRRLLFLCCLLAVFALENLWNRYLMVENYSRYRYIGYLYLFLTQVWHILVVFLLYEVSFEQVTICVVLGYTLELFPTAFLRYVLIDVLLPEVDLQHFGIYLGILFMTYLATYSVARVFVADRMAGENENEYRPQSRRPSVLYLLVYAGVVVLVSILQLILEKVLVPLEADAAYEEIYSSVYFLCVGAMALTALIVQVLFVYIYRATILTAESRLLGQLLESRGEQYAFLKENIDVINAKCHELKHRLKDLEVAGDEAHNRMLRQIRDSVNFYDANVKTGNEILDTILTQESTLCAAKGIKLICMADVKDIPDGPGVGVVDLYTMLSESLDNAISYTVLNPPDQKFISFRVQPVGDMLYFSIENYYPPQKGVTCRLNGIPVGADGKEHLRIVRQIARRAGGNVEVTIGQEEGNVLMVQVMVPVKGETPR